MEHKAEASVRIMYSQSICWRHKHSLNGVDGNKIVKGYRQVIFPTSWWRIILSVYYKNDGIKI